VWKQARQKDQQRVKDAGGQDAGVGRGVRGAQQAVSGSRQRKHAVREKKNPWIWYDYPSFILSIQLSASPSSHSGSLM